MRHVNYSEYILAKQNINNIVVIVPKLLPVMVFTIIITSIYVLHLQPCERKLTKVKQAGSRGAKEGGGDDLRTIPRRARESEKKVCYEKGTDSILCLELI